MKVQKLLNMQILWSFFAPLMINVSADNAIQLRIGSHSACQKACNVANSCLHYSYCNGICYFKKGEGWISKEKDGCISGNSIGMPTPIGNSPNNVVSKNTHYLYGDLKWLWGNKGLRGYPENEKKT